MRALEAPVTWLVVLLLGVGGVGCVPSAGPGEGEESDPDYQTGTLRKRARNYVRAIESFERALERNPRSAAAHFELGLIYCQNLTNYPAALYHFDRVQRLRPNANNIDVVQQLIKVCKQELVRDAMRVFTGENERDMARLEAAERQNDELRSEIVRLRSLLGQEPGRGGNDGGGLTPRQPAPADPPASPRGERGPESSPRLEGSSYTIRRGDTLYSIAQRHGMKVAALQTANPGVSPTSLMPGQVIRIPAAP